MNKPFCLSCEGIKESMPRDYCDACVKSLVSELASLRAQIADLKMNELFTSNTMVVLKDTIADLELQHVGDKAIIEALNERVGDLQEDAETEAHLTLCAQDSLILARRENESLKAQLTQLKRPPMTRDLPKVAGLYWYKADRFPTRIQDVIRITADERGVRIWGDDSIFPVEYADPGYWSARPIEMDPMPEGGE